MCEHNVVKVRKCSYNRVFNNRIIDAYFLTYRYVRTYDGISYITSCCDAYGWNNDGIGKLVVFRNGVSELFKQYGIGMKQAVMLLLLKDLKPEVITEGKKPPPWYWCRRFGTKWIFRL